MEDTIEAREVRIEGKGKHHTDYKVVDVETGKMMNDVRGIHFTISAGEPPVVTIEQYHWDGAELNIKVMATIKNKDHRFTDGAGRVWIDAANLSEQIQKQGTLCHRGKEVAVSYEFTEKLLREWEGKKPAPAVG